MCTMHDVCMCTMHDVCMCTMHDVCMCTMHDVCMCTMHDVLMICYVQASVSVKRLSKFLQNAELDPDMIDWTPEIDSGMSVSVLLLLLLLL